MTGLLWPLHIASTAVMTGVIWMVQLLQYPAFGRCPKDTFIEYHRTHSTRIAWIVGPAMVIELVTGALLFAGSEGLSRGMLGAGLWLIGVNWLSTALLQIPCHHRLSRGFDAPTHRRLVSTNRIRTAAWTVRIVLVSAAHHDWAA